MTHHSQVQCDVMAVTQDGDSGELRAVTILAPPLTCHLTLGKSPHGPMLFFPLLLLVCPVYCELLREGTVSQLHVGTAPRTVRSWFRLAFVGVTGIQATIMDLPW